MLTGKQAVGHPITATPSSTNPVQLCFAAKYLENTSNKSLLLLLRRQHATA
jgi:hypothetical protein